MPPERYRPPTKEEMDARNKKYLEKEKLNWDRASKESNINVADWRPEDILSEVSESLSNADITKREESLEKLRLLIAHRLLTNAVHANNPNLSSPFSEPKGGFRVKPGQFGATGKDQMILLFFTGTRGERVYVSPEHINIPWEQHDDGEPRNTTMLLRQALKALFPQAEGEDGESMIVPLP